MATTITGKLNKPANEFQAGESIGFGIRLGVQYYDRATKSKQWTNYSAVVFAKASAQIDYYRQVLQIGSVVELTATHEKIDVYEGQQGPSYTIELLNAQIGSVFATGDQPQQQQAQNAPRQQAPAAQPAPGGGYPDDDLDIPF